VIKISATGGVYGRSEGESVESTELTGEEIRVICSEAHRFGLKVAAHAISEEGIWNCIENGVDTIEHGHFMTEAAMDAMKEKNMTWVPTLYVYRQIAEGKDLPAYAVKKARRIVDIHSQAYKDGMKAGVRIGAGTDAGSPNTPHGSLLNELETMVECGCPPEEAVRTATLNGAHALGLEKEIGSLENGKKADILILHQNPLENIANLQKIYCIIKDGVIQLRWGR
jgi:imidazolonepropionase-like amidohydrolase